MEMEVDPYDMWSPTLVSAYRKAGHSAQVLQEDEQEAHPAPDKLECSDKHFQRTICAGVGICFLSFIRRTGKQARLTDVVQTYEDFLKFPGGVMSALLLPRLLMKSHSVLEEVQMASEGWLYDASFSGIPTHHSQPATSETGADVSSMIVELSTFWSSHAASWMNTKAAGRSALRQSPRELGMHDPGRPTAPEFTRKHSISSFISG
nr:uncharacterized protein LOC113460845 isoform X2 [Zonotrichia albicollis]